MSRQCSPKRLIVIAASPRSGSSLLFSALHACGIAGNSTEALNPRSFPSHLTGLSRLRYRIGRPYSAVEKASPRSVRNALRSIATESTMNDGTLAIKVMWDDLHKSLHAHGLDLDDFGGPITWVRIRRIDQVQQAVSYARAEQTQSWRSTYPVLHDPFFDADYIATKLEFLRQQDEGWDSYLSTRAAEPLQLTYEELDADYEGTMRQVLDFIGASDIVVPPPQLARQADQQNAEWVEQFRLSPHRQG